MAKKSHSEHEDSCNCGECDEPSLTNEDALTPLANLDKDTQMKIQEMQVLEQNFEQLLMQKQAFSLELNDTEHSLQELAKTNDDVFKIVGRQIIIKTNKEELQKDLKHKQELIELRLKNISKQEEDFSKKIVSLREDIVRAISSKKA